MKSSFGRVNAFAQPGRTAKPQLMVSTFFELKQNMPRPLLAQSIAFFATELLDSSVKISRTEPNAAQFHPMQHKVSTISNQRYIYAQ